MVLALQVDAGEGRIHEVIDRMGDARADHEVVRLVALEHHPHRLDVFLGEPPVAAGLQVAEHQLVGKPELDPRHALADPAGDEGLASPRRLVVEEDPGAGVQAEALAVVDGDEVAVDLGHSVRAARIEGGALALGGLVRPAEHLGGGGLVEARLGAHLADSLEQPRHADRGVLGGGDREPPGLRHRGHRGEVVDLVRSGLAENVDQGALIEQVAGIEGDPIRDRLEPLEVPVGRPADEAVDLVALLEQELGEVAAVLAADSRDQGALHGAGTSTRSKGISSARS